MRLPSQPNGPRNDSAVQPIAARAVVRVVDAMVDHLVHLGVTHAFGCTGGTVALFCEALARSSVQVVQCRHESGAAFAAMEAYFTSGHPTVVFTTSGPSILNALNGLVAARSEGAKVILVSGSTPRPNRGRNAFQETSPNALPHSLFTKGALFDYAIDVVDPSELESVARALEEGVQRPGAFVAHVSLPSALQGQRAAPLDSMPTMRTSVGPRDGDVRNLVDILSREPFAVWVGFGARKYASLVRSFLAVSGAPVLSTPRGRGIVPEHHPRFLGVTGLASPWDPVPALLATGARRLLVLGSRLGELTSLWDERLVPPGGLIQVDIDPDVTQVFPHRPRQLVQSDIGDLLTRMIARWPRGAIEAPPVSKPWPAPIALRSGRPVRPQVLMQVVQRVVVDADACLYVDCGNCYAWANSYLRFSEPRYRLSLGWGSMGQATAGVIGAAMVAESRCVALVGDGALLMQNELSTAVKYEVPAVWVVLNDAQYGMIEQGMRAGHLEPVETQIPRVDFAALAGSVGALGATVQDEEELEGALLHALASSRPFVVDVRIDRDAQAPIQSRVSTLETQGVGRTT